MCLEPGDFAEGTQRKDFLATLVDPVVYIVLLSNFSLLFLICLPPFCSDWKALFPGLQFVDNLGLMFHGVMLKFNEFFASKMKLADG